jgi:beta-lactamase regulating signal transducer with metallopeptidase domain
VTLLISATVKVSVLLLVALTSAAVLHRRSAAVRHWVLATAILCGISVPVLEFALPAWRVQLPAAWQSPTANSSLRFTSESERSTGVRGNAATMTASTQSGDRLASVARALLTLWLAGFAIGLGVLASGLLRLKRLASRAEPSQQGRWRTVAAELCRTYDLRRPIRLLHCAHPTMLVTWGTLRPTILLPTCAHNWSEERVRVVLHHELAHIRRGDWIVTLAATVLRSIYWFNPLLWIACRRLRLESERACDDLVLAAGVSGADYATQLLNVARESTDRHAWSPAIAIARPSTLEGRVRAMLNTRVNREPLTGRARAATLALVVSVTLPIGVVGLSGSSVTAERSPDIALASPALPADTPSASARAQTEKPRVAARPAAQSGAGTIEGVLYDQFGGLLPGVAVTLTHRSTGGRYAISTDPSGAFAFRTLPSGDYELTTNLPGFTTVTNVVTVAAGETVRRQITLPIGTVQETISVTCERSPIGVSPASGGRQQLGKPRTRPATTPSASQLFSGGIGGQIKAPTKTFHVSPVCPTGGPAIPALVRLVGRIGIDGFLSDLRDTTAEPQPALVASAMDAARQWEFTPTLLNGVPIEVNITIHVDYIWSQ